jgi:hypothetical protein
MDASHTPPRYAGYRGVQARNDNGSALKATGRTSASPLYGYWQYHVQATGETATRGGGFFRIRNQGGAGAPRLLRQERGGGFYRMRYEGG